MGSFKSERLKREDAVLVVVDVQEKLVPVISGVRGVIDNIVKLVKIAKIINLPVVITEQEKLGHTIDEIALLTEGESKIPKTTFSCFGCDEFKTGLNEFEGKTLLLTGIEAHICVMQTALDGLDKYQVHAICDAMSSRAPHNLEVALERMKQAGVTISSTEMAIYELLERAGTSEFREALPLLK